MDTCQTNQPLPYPIRRFVSRYNPQLQNAITKALRAKLEQGLLNKEIDMDVLSECVGAAVEELAIGNRNYRMEEESRQAYRSGQYVLLKDWINELRASNSASGQT